MKLALFNAALGAALAHAAGARWLAWDSALIWRALGASALAGFVAVLCTTRLEANARTKRLIPNTLSTWIFHAGVYFGILMLCIQELRDLRALAVLGVPLIFVTGLSIVAFGPIQDALVARAQRKARESTRSLS